MSPWHHLLKMRHYHAFLLLFKFFLLVCFVLFIFFCGLESSLPQYDRFVEKKNCSEDSGAHNLPVDGSLIPLNKKLFSTTLFVRTVTAFFLVSHLTRSKDWNLYYFFKACNNKKKNAVHWPLKYSYHS